MHTSFRHIALFSFFLLTEIEINAQPLAALKVGDQLPSSISKTLPKEKTTKLILLDLWSTTCAACIGSFPKLEKLQHEFKENLQIYMVNNWETDLEIAKRFEKLNKNKETKIVWPVGVKSLSKIETFADYFPSLSIPHLIWINDQYRIIAISDSRFAISKYIQAAINGEQLSLPVKDDFLSSSLNEGGLITTKTFLLKPIYYSSLLNFDPSSGYSKYHIIKNILDSSYLISLRGSSIIDLYILAFAKGNDDTRVLFKSKNTIIGQHPNSIDSIIDWERKYFFSYEMQGPLKQLADWSKIMQEDLNRYFGNRFDLEAAIVKRKLKSYILIKSKDGLLKTSGGVPSVQKNDSALIWKKVRFGDLLRSNLFLKQLENLAKGIAFVNETNIPDKEEVDIQLSGDLKDIANLKKQLSKYGLDIIEGEREIEFLLIQDK